MFRLPAAADNAAHPPTLTQLCPRCLILLVVFLGLGLAPADVLPAALRDGRLSVSCEGQSHRVFLIYRQENISESAPRLLVGAALYRPCNKSGSSEIPAPLAREQACSAMCIADI